MSYWMREYKKALKRNELLKRRLSNLRRACRTCGWSVEAIRAIEACRAAGVGVNSPPQESCLRRKAK